MPYNYLTINESGLNSGLVSASYFDVELQSLYEQQYKTNEIFFGDSDDDLIEFSLYNSGQEPLSFNRVVPSVTYSVVQDNYLDINGLPKNYRVLNPNTNITKFGDNILLHPQFDLKFNQVSPGLYYLLYNPTRNMAGNSINKLVIKEISPSRTELRLSFAFNQDASASNRLLANKITAFADKKYLFLQLEDDLISIIDNNPISQNFFNQKQNLNLIKTCQNLGFKNEADLTQFIIDSYVGFDRILVLNRTENSDILSYQSVKFTGIAQQLKNFIYQYNDTEFSSDEIQRAFKTIVTKVSQDRIVQKTSLNAVDLQDAINLFVQIIYTDWLQPQTDTLLANYSERFFGLYKNALNFDNGNLVKILSHTSYYNAISGVNNIQVKLDDPLPTEYGIKSTCWISNISIAPLYFKVNIYADSVSRKVYLNGVNFSVQVPTINPTNDRFADLDKNTLFYAQSKLKEKVNDLLINYDNFDNFINYSSAELRSKIAKNKISQYSSYDTSKEQISQQSDSANTAISSSLSEKYDSITQNQINLLNTFDEYESYLFFNTSSIDDKIQDGVSYDRDNYDSLLNQLPEYLKNDPQSEDYIKFTSMVGHFFDNILVYIKKFPRSYPINYNDNNDYPKNYIEELLNSFNWNVDNVKFEKSDISQLLFNASEQNGSLSSSYFDYAKSILNRFANNMSGIYKTKGTTTSYELVRSIFGVSADLIQPVEYGSSDVLVNRQVFYDFDDIVYMSKFTNNEYIKFNYTGSEFILKSTGLPYSQSATPGTGITQSFAEIFTGLSALECSFKFNKNNYEYLDRIPIIKKYRNNNIDWEIYIKKATQQVSGQLIFNFQPQGTDSNSIVLQELPLLNGDVYTILLTRDVAPGVFDTPSTTINYSPLTQSITSSAANKFAPYVYTLAINQYYGSQLNFTAKKNSTILYDHNRYFSSGSYHVGNFSSSVKFVGNIDKVKVYLDPVSSDNFDEHSYNINSFAIDDKEREYKNARYVWSFDTPVSLYSSTPITLVPNQNLYYKDNFQAVNFPAQVETLPYPICKPMVVTKFPYQFDKLSLKQSINSNKFGPNYRNNSKINKINMVLDTNLVPSEQSSYTEDVIGGDSNLVGYYISPYQYLNSKIEDFLGKEGITDVIGNPAYLTKQNYPELKTLQAEFAKLNEKYVYPQEFLSTYKFYIDFSIFDFIKNLTPQRATLKRGILLEPSIFERVKFNYRNVDVTALDPDNPLASSSSLITFNNYATFTSSLINTNDTSSYGIVALFETNDIDTDNDQYNYSMFEIKPSYDVRDFVYSKYGKDIGVDNNGPYIRDLPKVNQNSYYLMTNNKLPSVVGFTSSYFEVQIAGSGSVTGSRFYRDLYKGDMDSGYSKRHLSKFVFAGSRNRYRAVSGSITRITNGVKLDKSAGSLTYYQFTKGKNDYSRTVNRSGLPNGSLPVISIPGFLSMEVTSSTFPKYGVLTGSVGKPKSIFVQLPITASIYTSASLDMYIMNL